MKKLFIVIIFLVALSTSCNGQSSIPPSFWEASISIEGCSNFIGTPFIFNKTSSIGNKGEKIHQVSSYNTKTGVICFKLYIENIEGVKSRVDYIFHYSSFSYSTEFISVINYKDDLITPVENYNMTPNDKIIALMTYTFLF